MKDILDIIKNIDTIYSANSSLSVLKDVERVFDEMDLYVYKNWFDGELAEGPVVDRHWIKTSFMWEESKMPDPMGGKRLIDYGCRVKYEKTVLATPRKIESPDDYRPGTKKGKLDRTPVWVVTIEMPKKLVSDVFNGYMTKMRETMGIGQNERIDTAPVEAADVAAVSQPAAVPAAAPVAPAVGGAPDAA